ncbi:hypothetical protein [Nocardia carnea]|nr:hypothetical protein [Nocardia carnea]
MTDFATPQELARRTSAAVDAAGGAAPAQGVAGAGGAVVDEIL